MMKQGHALLAVTLIAIAASFAGCGSSGGANSAEKAVANSPTAGEAAAPQTGTATAKLNSEDKEFFSSAAKDGYADIQLAQTALKKSHNKDVQEFAQKIIDDHQKLNGDLARLASTKGVTLPDSASLASSIKEGTLKLASGSHFDRSFMQRMIKGHQDTIELFEKEANGGSDIEVKDFATTNLSNLKGHLSSAQELINKLNTQHGGRG